MDFPHMNSQRSHPASSQTHFQNNDNIRRQRGMNVETTENVNWGNPYMNSQSSQHPTSSQTQHSQSNDTVRRQKGNDTVRRQKGKGKSVETIEKANWDRKTTEIFITYCVEELKAGNRPGSHFNRIGWENITRKFSESTNRNYTRLQLKNRWDLLRNDWGIWKALLRNESGLGWDSVRGTIDQTPEWWERKLKEVPKGAKFRERGPLLLDDQEMLFSDVVATGGSAWTPSSGALPSHLIDEQAEDYSFHVNDVNENENEPEDENDANTNTQAESSGPQKRNVLFNKRFRPMKNKKMTSAAKLANCIERLVDTIGQDSSPTRSSNDTSRKYTIQQCMDILDEIPQIIQGDKLWMYATRLFLKPAVREMFLTIKTNDVRFMWLQDQMERGEGSRATRGE